MRRYEAAAVKYLKDLGYEFGDSIYYLDRPNGREYISKNEGRNSSNANLFSTDIETAIKDIVIQESN